jgi:antirestriction protein ArdC
MRSAQHSDCPCDVPNHASYLQSWIEVLKQDRREIFHAAAEAQRIADYILGFHPDHADESREPVKNEDEARLNPPLAA